MEHKRKQANVREIAQRVMKVSVTNPEDAAYLQYANQMLNEYADTLPEPDEIDWSHVHPDYNFMARDSDDRARLYKWPPTLNLGGGVWDYDTLTGEPIDPLMASGFASYKRGTLEWDVSLVERSL